MHFAANPYTKPCRPLRTTKRGETPHGSVAWLNVREGLYQTFSMNFKKIIVIIRPTCAFCDGIHDIAVQAAVDQQIRRRQARRRREARGEEPVDDEEEDVLSREINCQRPNCGLTDRWSSESLPLEDQFIRQYREQYELGSSGMKYYQGPIWCKGIRVE